MVLNSIKNLIKKMLVNRILKNTTIRRHFEDRIYNPYDRIKMLKPIKITKISESFEPDFKNKFSLITPVKNEEEGIEEFIRSVENQIALPEEFIIVDGGSTDRTVEMINKIMQSCKLKIRLLEIKSKSISEQRNLAIRTANNEHIILADAGNILDKNYCSNMIGVFSKYEDADLVGAIYYALHSEFSNYFIYDWMSFNEWDGFLPAGKTMAIKKSLALEIGGFPEYLAYAGEDALFDVNYRKVSKHWVFNSRAFVYWDIPRTMESTIKKFISYGIGDGESGWGDQRFYSALMRSRINLNFIDNSPVTNLMFTGYLKGRDKRGEIEFSKRNIKRVNLCIFKKTLHVSDDVINRLKEMHDKNEKVIYLSCDRDFSEEKYINIDFTLLELYDINDFILEDFWRRYGSYNESISIFYEDIAMTNIVARKLVDTLFSMNLSIIEWQ